MTHRRDGWLNTRISQSDSVICCWIIGEGHWHLTRQGGHTLPDINSAAEVGPQRAERWALQKLLWLWQHLLKLGCLTRRRKVSPYTGVWTHWFKGESPFSADSNLQLCSPRHSLHQLLQWELKQYDLYIHYRSTQPVTTVEEFDDLSNSAAQPSVLPPPKHMGLVQDDGSGFDNPNMSLQNHPA